MKKLLSFLLLISFAAGAQTGTGERVAYYYQGKKISFPVNNTRVVMQLKTGETLANRRAQLSAFLQVPDTAIIALPGGKLAVAKLPASAAFKLKDLTRGLLKQVYIDFVHPCFTSAYGKDMGYADQLVLKLKRSTGKTALDNILKQVRATIIKKYPFSPDVYIVSAGSANGFDALAVANRLFETGLFEYAQPDFTLFDGLFTDPNDPLFGYQWGHTNTGSPIQYNGVAGTDMKIQNAWGISTGTGITIAVIDEGVDTGHADLKANLLQGFNCLTGTSNPGDGMPLAPTRGHGTSCAGIIAAVANNNIGVAGVAPDSKIIPINLAAANGNFTTESNIAAGFDYAWQHGADVISNSWGGGSPSNVLDDAISRAVTLGRGGKGSVVLFASGNNNAALSYPAVNPNVISVGGVNMCGQRKSPASSSCDGEGWGASFGTGLDVVAPCIKIATTDISGSGGYNTAAGAAGDYFLRFNGTSSATPNTAGVVALMLSANNNLSINQVTNILEGTCDKLPLYNYGMVAGQPNGSWNAETGHGLVNAFNAVQTALSGIYCNVQVKANGATRFCPGGSVNLSIINPVMGTSYQWRKDGNNIASGTSITANASGTYDVVATAANGCIAVAAPLLVTELVNIPPLTAYAGIDTLICAGQSVKLGGDVAAANGAPWLPEKRAYGMDWQGNSFVRFSLDNPLQFDTIAKNVVSNADYAAEKFFTGGDFTPYGYYAITQISNQLIKVDTATGAQQLIGTAPAPSGYQWSGMAWDPSTKNLYGLACAASGSSLCIINPFTAAVTPVALVPVPLTEWLAISNNGDAYVMSDNNYVYRINTTTGAAMALPNPVGADVIYQQDADFDPVTNNLYLTTILLYQNYVSDLRSLNTTTGISSVIGSLGGLSEIDATGIAGPGYQYNWLPAAGLNSTQVSVPVATPATTTTYTLQVTDMCGNTASNQVTVQVSTPPAAAITAATDSICVGETVRLNTAANDHYSYQWFRNAVAISGATDSFFTAAAGGVYTVSIINGACDSLSAPFTVKTCSLLLNNNSPVSLCATYFFDSGGENGNYNAGESFTKTITAGTSGNLLKLILQTFKTTAVTDVLTIYDGPDIGAPVLAVLTGSPVIPVSYTARSGKLTFRFVSSGATSDAGWAGAITCYQPAVYRSSISGDAENSSTWEIKSGSNFINASNPPQVYDDSVLIQPGHTVTLHVAAELDQLWIKAGAILKVAAALTLNDGAGTDMLSEGVLIIDTAGSISGNGSIILTGTLDNSASANSHVQVPVAISGTAPQTIIAGGSFNALYVTNPAVSLVLSNPVFADSILLNNGNGTLTVTALQPATLLTINKKLDLQNGRLVAGRNSVVFVPETAVLSGGHAGSFVEGPLRRNTSAPGQANLFFPIGAVAYRPVTLAVTHLLAGPSAYQATAFNTAPGNRSLPASINAVSNKRYFTIEQLGSLSVSNATATFSYGADDLVTDTGALRIAKDNGGSGWIDIGGTGTAIETGSITSTINFTGFGEFVLANAVGGSNAFAMRWLQADATLYDKQIRITWSIGNEVNTNNYTVERSADGVSFTDITFLNANPGRAPEKNYAAIDRLPLKGDNYYRIRQTANDGRISYSRIMQVNVNEVVDFIVWPNPATSIVMVQNRQSITRLQCFNSNGQLVYNVQPGANQHTIPVQRWASGIYNLKMTCNGKILQARFVKQ